MKTLIKLYYFIFCLFLTSNFCLANEKDDIKIIKENFYKVYVEGSSITKDLTESLILNPPGFNVSDRVVMELQQRVPFSDKFIEELLSKLNEDGGWSDIDYEDRTRSGWNPRLHPERILGLVKSCIDKHNKYYKSERLINAIHLSLDFWFRNKLKCPNWYYNEVGVPRTLGVAFVLFEEYMTKKEKEQAIELMKISKFGMTGQNRVWLAGNVMMRALLENNYQLVKQARDIIVSEIVTGNKEGIKDDWSFHQHGAQQQFGNYGLAYISSMSLFSGILSDTSLEFTDQHLEVIASLLNEGYQWIIWNGKMDISSLGRQLFRSAQEHKALAVAFAAAELGGGKNQYCNNIAKRIIENCFSKKNDLIGCKHFWQSDYTVMRQKDWMASVKMSSKRVVGTESINGDNKKGYYLGDGALFVYKDASEYINIFPVWNWRRVPGITTYIDDKEMPVLKNPKQQGNQEDFVGGLSVGKQGMSVMDINRDGIKEHKLWLFTEKAIVVLGSGITSDSILNVSTSIEQCWFHDSLYYYNGKKWNIIENYKTGNSDNRFLFGNKGYIVPGNRCVTEVTEKEGKWNDIMQLYKTETEDGKIMSIYMDHGSKPEGASFQYYIIPNTDKEKLINFDINDLKIIDNNKKIQVVYDSKEKCWWIAAWENGNVSLDNIELKIKTPGLYYIKPQSTKLEIVCCDPTQKKEFMELELNNRNNIKIELPKGNYKGKEVAMTFTL